MRWANQQTRYPTTAMKSTNQPARLTDQQKLDFCGLVSVGCDRETAGKYCGGTPGQLRREMELDAKFAKEVVRAEGTAEFAHMRTLHEAAKDVKNWRVSMWWLERRAPERFARRPPRTIPIAKLDRLLEEIASLIVEGVTDQRTCRRLLKRLEQVAGKVADASCSSSEEASPARLEQKAVGDSLQHSQP